MAIYTFKKVWQRELVHFILIFALGCAMAFVFDTSLFNKPWINIRLSMTYSGFMWLFFWKGNSYLVDFWNKRISWLEQPGKRFIIGVITVLVYTPLVIVGLNTSYNLLPGVSTNWGGVDVLISIGITFFITFFMFAKTFLDNWRKASLDTERIKREQMSTKYESLKNQVNPHFLFNSLNALTNLVYEDQDMAADFIRKLSKVYRYVLDNQSKEVVPLETELAFVNSYLFLQRIRFDDKLKVKIDISGYENRMIPPIALQMLFENAIKHNTIAEEEPLYIDVHIENGELLVIKNNLQKKNIPIEESSGVGLKNIKARYEFLSPTKVEIQETDSEFIVKLPLLSFSE
ncbi:sensor histidine kinase [Roseivirga sp. E12]|uniref:sensor histidine kinase n=1 Tax=Roseivirga sp. E12 TaxID=2819237 RepID=UPI001ABC1106|nr:histidine kinase [Roseivirga sp. E12]MBO3698829.1 histidine kinase [Roseivirga sp. E12]